MNLTIKGKQIEVGDSLRDHITKNLNDVIKKYFGDAIEGSVILSKDRHLFKADVQVHIGRGILVQSSGDATEPYPAFDIAAEKVGKRLRRYKSRLRDHHKRESSNGVLSSPYYILQAESPDVVEEPTAPAVIAEMTTNIESMTVSEAVMRMDLADLSALMFRNKAHGKLNMVYRRQDGNIGWVDPRDL